MKNREVRIVRDFFLLFSTRTEPEIQNDVIKYFIISWWSFQHSMIPQNFMVNGLQIWKSHGGGGGGGGIPSSSLPESEKPGLFGVNFLHFADLLIQDSSGSAGTDDPMSQYKGGPTMKIISDKIDLSVRQFLRTGANVNFQIASALACLLDIRIIYTSSCICLGTKL